MKLKTVCHILDITLCLICLMAFLSCKDENQHEYSRRLYVPQESTSNNTQRMVETLEDIYNKVEFTNHQFSTEEVIKIKEIQIAKGKGLKDKKGYFVYARLLLRAGESDKCIKVIQDLFESDSDMLDVNDQTIKFHKLLAIAYLRKGEIDNCVVNHNSESCLFPIKGKAIHTLKEGSRGAIEIYEDILFKYNDDYESRWLLNVAYMTLGQYPNEVPQQYLIKPEFIEDDIKLESFTNKAMEAGLDINDLSGGCVLDDLDNDGDLDLFASSWALNGQLKYFENHGGKFIDKTIEAGLQGLYGGLSLKQTDYNNDGYLDLFIVRGAWRKNIGMGIYPNSLLRNDGDGTFTDVTFETGLYEIGASQSVVWIDLDNDGWLDLFVANESRLKNKCDKFPCRLYINNGDSTFTEKSKEYRLNLYGYFKGVAAADYDNDGDQDMYITNLNGNNVMIKNQLSESGSLSFTFESEFTNTQEPKQAFPCWFFDYDNDGWEDLYVSSFGNFSGSGQTQEVAKSYLGLELNSDVPRLYHNNGKGSFKNEASEMGLGLALHTMGCNFGDINNDGYLDFYLGTGAPDFRSIVPNRLFLNQKGQSFVDVTTSANVGNIQKGHGVSIADIDNDGDQDIYTVLGGAYSGDFFQNALYMNPGNQYHSVKVKLIGSKTNRAGIGSKIKITITENKKQRNIFRTVSNGASFGANSITQEIGVGNAQSIDKLEVLWANGTTKYVDYGSQPIGKRILITEGKKEVEIENIISYSLVEDSKHQNHHHH